MYNNQFSHIHRLHAIRGYAALFVVIAHAKFPFWSGGNVYLEKYPLVTWHWYDFIFFTVDMATSSGNVFVTMFFVLSGFFIGRSLLEKKYSIMFFYGDRLIRIYIPVIGSMVITYLCLLVAHDVNPSLFDLIGTGREYNESIINAYHDLNWSVFLNTLWFNPTGKSGFYGFNYPYWSLWYEMIFYITVVFLLRKCWFIFIAVILHVCSFFIDYSWLSILSYTNFILFFAMGFFLYQVLSSKYGYRLKSMVEGNTNTLICLSVFLLFAALFFGLLHIRKASDDIAMLSTVCFILWILYGSEGKLNGIASSLMNNPFSRFLSKISFSMYLIHVPVMIVLYSVLNLLSHKIVYYDRLYWFALLLVVPVSYLFYYLFEKPSLLVLKKYKSRVK